MTLLDPPPESPTKHYALKITLIIVVMALIIGGWFAFRYYPEKRAVDHFLDALVAGDTAHAYQLWQPSASYKMGDFLADWGPEGYYGPIKSYEILRATSPKQSNGVIVSVAVSPFSPMPAASDAQKSRRTKVIPVFVDPNSKALSFSPTTPED